jgi:hypothetical protein
MAERDVQAREAWGPVPDAFSGVATPDQIAEQEVRIGKPPIVVFHRIDHGWVEVMPGVALPTRFEAVVTEEDYAPVHLALVVEERRAVLDQVLFYRRPGDPPLRVTKMRPPLDRYATRAAAIAAVQIVANDDGSFGAVRSDETAIAFLENYEPIPRARRRGRKLSEAELKKAARIYREALPSGKPVKALRDEIPMSRSTAHRWIEEARRRGFLGNEAARPKRRTKRKGKSNA